MSWSQKTRVPGLSDDKNPVVLQLLVLSQYQRVTDRQCCGVFKYCMYLNTKSAQKVLGQSI